MKSRIFTLILTLCVLFSCLSLTVSAEGELNLLDAITDGVFPTASSKWVYSVDANTTEQPTDGLGGKAQDDAYAKIKVPGSKNTRAGLIMVNTNSKYFTKNYCVYSVNIFGDTPVTFIMRKTSAGNIYEGSKGDFKSNQWNNLTILYDRVNWQAEVYINGKLHDTKKVGSGQRDAQLRLQMTDTTAGYYYIDDLAIYDSDTEPTISAPVIKDASNGEYTLSDGNVLIPTDGATVSSINVTEGAVIRVFTNDEYSYQLSDSDTLSDGCKIIVVKDNIYNYYTVNTSVDVNFNLIYSANFSGGTFDSDMGLANENYYKTAYATGVAGKLSGDTSLNFKRDAATAPSEGYLGDNINTYLSVPTDKAYIKYELNFMPGDDNFLKAFFKTKDNESVSTGLFCTDAGSGNAYCLSRHQWNKITYVFKNSSSTDEDVSGTYTIYVNGKQISSGATTLKKDAAGSSTAHLAFAVYGKDTTNSDDASKTDYSAISCYIDDIEVRYHESEPAIREMPYAVDDGGENTYIEGNEYIIYTGITAGDVEVCTGASYVVYDEPSFQYTLADAAQLYVGNVIVVSDRYNQYTYYTVKVQTRNKATITPYSGYYIAKTNLKDAIMFVVGYDDNGAIKGLQYTDESGNVEVKLVDTYGEFDTVKAIVMDKLSTLKPLSVATTYTSSAVVACWGDSITNGQGATDRENDTYPATLAKLSGLNVYNMGIGGETQVTIAARQGALDIKLTEDVTIPATCTPVEIDFLGYFKSGELAGPVVPRNEAIGGWNPVVINGVEGTIDVQVTTSGSPRDMVSATFKRTTAGQAVEAKKGDLILTDGRNYTAMADINVILATINGGWTDENNQNYDSDALIKILDEMIAKTKDPSKYVIIGPVTCQMRENKKAQLNAAVEALRTKYGNKFLDLRGYLASEQALIDAGITPTATDLADLANGHIPSSFGSGDTVHLNSAGYERAGHKLYEKFIELGYCAASAN